MRKTLIIIVGTALFVTATIYAPICFKPLNKLVISTVEKRLETKLAFGSLRFYIWESLIAEKIEALGKGGFGLKAEKATIDYDLTSLVTGRLHVTCRLDRVKFYKGSPLIDSVTDLLYIEPLGNITFDRMDADLFVGMEDTITQDLRLTSDKIRILGDAHSDKEDNVRCFLRFYLSDDIVKDIPDELKGTLLKSEGEGWSSLHVGIIGNYSKPIFRILTEGFKLNISS
jgi:hypothetical protein